MATRFGAPSPAKAYATKVRWIIGSLSATILILVAVILIIANQTADTPPDANPSTTISDPGVANASTQAQPAVEVLVANQRIEIGSPLMPHMFISQAVPLDRQPAGAIPAAQKDALVGKYAKNLINANLPLLQDDISDQKPLTSVIDAIPPGFRAVTIQVDARSAVEGWAQPNSRVDVLWTYKDKDGEQRVATIVHFSKVLSVGGATANDPNAQKGGASTVTLLVSETDAKKIELARNLGSLSLSLVGGSETGKVTSDPDPIDITQIVPRGPEVAAEEPDADGVMYATDPATGKQIKFILQGKQWKRDPNF
ncbi:Flp pilus assembly protein CpaB [bacterium]|nr:Flp pilus assembly protein CpaB [bacterium]